MGYHWSRLGGVYERYCPEYALLLCHTKSELMSLNIKLWIATCQQSTTMHHQMQIFKNFAKASQIISKTNWNDLVSEDIDLYCTHWPQTSLSIMAQCIPKRVLPPRKHNLPWLNKSLVQSMRRRNALFQKAKKSSNPIFKNQYRRARNQITAQLRHATEILPELEC